MKPIAQSIKGRHGNCLQACLASILELKLADVPNFAAMKDDPNSAIPIWWLEMQAWLKKRGLCFVEMALTTQTPVMPMPWHPIVLFFGLTAPGVSHCIVGQIGHDDPGMGHTCLYPLWNPDPDAKITGVMSLGLLLPLDASKMTVEDRPTLIS